MDYADYAEFYLLNIGAELQRYCMLSCFHSTVLLSLQVELLITRKGDKIGTSYWYAAKKLALAPQQHVL